eukprot:GEMP01002044.1.p1 GENE.GEMP01002044.1~~GEMP01002044.1.p1  ORF type:complete len:1664 (+),score=258.57 GEMP01002044.1:268-4992(+)
MMQHSVHGHAILDNARSILRDTVFEHYGNWEEIQYQWDYLRRTKGLDETWSQSDEHVVKWLRNNGSTVMLYKMSADGTCEEEDTLSPRIAMIKTNKLREKVHGNVHEYYLQISEGKHEGLWIPFGGYNVIQESIVEHVTPITIAPQELPWFRLKYCWVFVALVAFAILIAEIGYPLVSVGALFLLVPCSWFVVEQMRLFRGKDAPRAVREGAARTAARVLVIMLLAVGSLVSLISPFSHFCWADGSWTYLLFVGGLVALILAEGFQKMHYSADAIATYRDEFYSSTLDDVTLTVIESLARYQPEDRPIAAPKPQLYRRPEKPRVAVTYEVSEISHSEPSFVEPSLPSARTVGITASGTAVVGGAVGLSLIFPPAAPFVLLMAGVPAIASVGYATAKAIKDTIGTQQEEALSDSNEPLLGEESPSEPDLEQRAVLPEPPKMNFLDEKPTTSKFIFVVWLATVLTIGMALIFYPAKTWEERPCPPNSFRAKGTNEANCACLVGYAGNISWDGRVFLGECAPTNCPSLSYRCDDCEDPTNGTGMQCRCFEGAIGGVFWAEKDQRWEGMCDCPPRTHRSDRVNAYGKMEAVCVCTDMGYIGTLNTYALAEGEHCEILLCPVNSIGKGGGESCACAPGHHGKLAFSKAQNQYTGVCTAVKPPPGVLGHGPGEPCICKDGWHGNCYFDSKANVYVSTCSEVGCPPHTIGQGGGLPCMPHKGFIGSVTWDTTKYIGSTMAVSCPENAGPPGECTCMSGYEGDLSFDGEQWHGICAPLQCPPNSKGPGMGQTCSCLTGYTGELAFEQEHDTYSGDCILIPCPANATGSGGGATCTCMPGFLGTPRWSASGNVYEGHCSKEVECPVHSTGTGQPNSCTCQKGTKCTTCEDGKTLEFDAVTKTYSGECTPLACPEHSQRCKGEGSELFCCCIAGTRGELLWDNVTAAYNGHCVRDACPPNSVQSKKLVEGEHYHHFQCKCIPGYFGDITWQCCGMQAGYHGSCGYIPDPSHSTRVSKTDAVCSVGFSGNLVYDENLQAFKGACRRPCPANAYYKNVTEVNCQCVPGYEGGGFTWEDEKQTFFGQCSAVPCPANAQGHGGGKPCRCRNFFKSATARLAWDSKKNAYAGECREAPCPPNSNTVIGGNGCECPKYYSSPSGPFLGWNSDAEEFIGTCEVEACPKNSLRSDTILSSLKCYCEGEGLEGKVTWNKGKYVGTCQKVPCPAISDADGTGIGHTTGFGGGAACTCGDGFTGDVHWNADAKQYKADCALVSCPAGSYGKGGAGGCQCLAGYRGFIHFDAVTETYQGQCTRAQCPEDSSWGTEGCACLNPLATQTRWDGSKQTWSPCGSAACQMPSILSDLWRGLLTPFMTCMLAAMVILHSFLPQLSTTPPYTAALGSMVALAVASLGLCFRCGDKACGGAFDVSAGFFHAVVGCASAMVALHEALRENDQGRPRAMRQKLALLLLGLLCIFGILLTYIGATPIHFFWVAVNTVLLALFGFICATPRIDRGLRYARQGVPQLCWGLAFAASYSVSQALEASRYPGHQGNSPGGQAGAWVMGLTLLFAYATLCFLAHGATRKTI